MGAKVYFISDAHLGSGNNSRERESDLVSLLQEAEKDAESVVFVGDMFDFWFTYKHVVPKGYTRLLGQLAVMADKGIELHYFIGNHDMWIFDYFSTELGMKMHDGIECLHYQGKRILVGHGDGLDPKDKKYNLIKKIFRNRVNQWLFARVHPGIGFGIATRWSHKSRESHGSDCQNYKGDENEAIFQYCLKRLRKEPYDYFVFGHRHGQVVRDVRTGERNATYVNVGNWIEERDYAVLENGELKVMSLH